jgi:hypothetical protein
LLARVVRIVAFDFLFSIPDALLRDEKFAVEGARLEIDCGGAR